MSLAIAVVVLLAATLLFTLLLRTKDLAPGDEVSPTQHLEERRAAIYENLRDLQFEYLVGKLSDADYQQTKLSLQKELATVITEIQNVTQGAPKKGASGTVPAASTQKAAAAGNPKSVMDSISAQPLSAQPMAAEPAIAEKDPAQASGFVCPHCGHQFAEPMKFCGECGKAMS